MKKLILSVTIIFCLLLVSCNQRLTSGNGVTTAYGAISAQMQSEASASTTQSLTESVETSITSEQTGADDKSQLMQKESLGLLKYGMDEKAVTDGLGVAEEKSEAVEWGSDGLIHQSWYYKSKGIELNMVKKENKFNVFTIKISKPCEYKTKKGIGIGSTKADVQASYEKEINEAENSSDGASLVAGSIYGGVIFTFEGDAVTDIFIGAAAE
jgi:hypothetical protein